MEKSSTQGGKIMLIKITGKNEMLEKLNTAKQMIDEAEKILWGLNSTMDIEIVEDSPKDPDEVLAETYMKTTFRR